MLRIACLLAVLASAAALPLPAATGHARETARVYFENHKRQRDPSACGVVFGRNRTLATAHSRTTVLTGAMHQLLRGPTRAERGRGDSSWFSAKTKRMLRGVWIVRGETVRVDFGDLRRVIGSASSSCGSVNLLAALNSTIRGVVPGARPIYSLRGDCRAFAEWLQRVPPPACPPHKQPAQVTGSALSVPAIAPAAVHGGSGTVSQSAVGSLRFGQSHRSDVERFAGTPDAVIADRNSYTGATHTVLGYLCRHKGRTVPVCQTYYGIDSNGNRFANFTTRATRFETPLGSRVGMVRSEARRREHRRITDGCLGDTITIGGSAGRYLTIILGPQRVRALSVHGPGGGDFWSC